MWERFKQWLRGGYDCRLQGVIDYLTAQGFHAAAEELKSLRTENNLYRGRR